MIGTTLSRYRLLEQIGAGGMGVVYRAQDERLMRGVAIKVIGPGLLADDAARRRFRKEPLALSQLSHPNIAVIHYDWDWTGAEGEFRRAIGLSPNYSVAHLWYANFLAARGRFEQALAEGRKARELDPLSMVAHHVLGWICFFMRDFERSLSQRQATLEVDRQWVYGYVWVSWPMQQLGRHDEAIASLERAVDLSGGTTLTRAFLAHGLAFGGRNEEARALLAILIEQSSTRYVSPFLVALVWIGLGERDRAFEWLEKACEDRSHWFVFVDVDARLDPVRDDPRFESVRRRVGVGTGATSTGNPMEPGA